MSVILVDETTGAYYGDFRLFGDIITLSMSRISLFLLLLPILLLRVTSLSAQSTDSLRFARVNWTTGETQPRRLLARGIHRLSFRVDAAHQSPYV